MGFEDHGRSPSTKVSVEVEKQDAPVLRKMMKAHQKQARAREEKQRSRLNVADADRWRKEAQRWEDYASYLLAKYHDF